jgi:hypothetical protein
MIVRLSARAKPSGGAVVPVRSDTPMPALARLVVLVHGYNNDQPSAAASYAAFRAHADAATFGTFWTVAEFFWPGDKPWGVISALSYPAEIGYARDSARALLAFLRTLTGPGGAPVEVAFVTHSLGGRLLMELLDAARQQQPALIVTAACVMAPAVPVDRVETGGVLRAAAQFARRITIFHSEHDKVLKWAFRAGQFAAGEGFFTRAVGRFGEPRRGLWAVSMPTAHDHGEYWAGQDCADEASRQLGSAAPRILAERALPRHALASASTPQRAAVSDRPLGTPPSQSP